MSVNLKVAYQQFNGVTWCLVCCDTIIFHNGMCTQCGYKK
jgi:hypothetical protein